MAKYLALTILFGWWFWASDAKYPQRPRVLMGAFVTEAECQGQRDSAKALWQTTACFYSITEPRAQ